MQMGLPVSIDARLFYRCALLRYEEARVLLREGHATGAVYLAGYGVECILKALILETVPASKRKVVYLTFRGNHAHSFEWLRTLYIVNGGVQFSKETVRHFRLVSDWDTNMRYSPRTTRAREAKAFIEATTSIIKWAQGRM